MNIIVCFKGSLHSIFLGISFQLQKRRKEIFKVRSLHPSIFELVVKNNTLFS